MNEMKHEEDSHCKMMQAALALLREKDAEIERLQEIADAVADSFPVCEGCEGKTEFGERTEHCLYEIDDTFCTQRATKMWFALRGENEELHKEIERKNHILESYALQYGTARDKEHFLSKARDEAVAEYIEKAKARLPIISPSVFDQIAKEMKGDQR